MDVSQRCRLCYKDAGDDPLDLFQHSDKNYPSQLEELLNIKMDDLPNWPRFACNKCIETLDLIDDFKKIAQSTQTILLQLRAEDVTTQEIEASDTGWVEDGDYNDIEDPSDRDSQEEEEVTDEEEEQRPPKRGRNARKLGPPTGEKELAYEAQFKDMGLLRCNLCARESACIAELLQHVEESHADRRYQYCCKLLLKRPVADVYAHLEYHRNPSAYQCQICQKQYPIPASLAGHMYTVHNTPGGSRPKATRRSGSVQDRLVLRCQRKRQRLSAEDVAVNEELRKRDLLRCPEAECAERQDTVQDLFIHCAEVHSSRGFVTCCGHKFSSDTLVYEHVKYHWQPDLWTCAQCQKRCMSALQLHTHQKVSHPTEADLKHKCDVCGRSFAFLARLRKHQVKHMAHQDRPHRCPECGRGFAQSHLLRDHIGLRHNTDTAVICDVCGEGFPTLVLLKRHAYKHTEMYRALREQDHAKVSCAGCGLVLTRGSMRTHKRKCRGPDQSVTCGDCGQLCKNPRSLASHRAMKHKTPKAEGDRGGDRGT